MASDGINLWRWVLCWLRGFHEDETRTLVWQITSLTEIEHLCVHRCCCGAFLVTNAPEEPTNFIDRWRCTNDPNPLMDLFCIHLWMYSGSTGDAL